MGLLETPIEPVFDALMAERPSQLTEVGSILRTLLQEKDAEIG